MKNLTDGYRPIVVTLKRGVIVACELAHRRIIDGRVDVLDIHQFVTSEGRREALCSTIDRYNQTIEECETDWWVEGAHHIGRLASGA